MTPTMTVAVHGATGTQGAPVVRRLLEAGHRVRALTRTVDPGRVPPGAEAVTTDLREVGSLVAAYRGADAVVVQLPGVFGPEAVPMAETVADALERAAVGRVVFNTSGPAPSDPVGVPYLDARSALARRLQATPASVTVLGPAMGYMENFAAPWSEGRVVRDGVLAYPLPDALEVPWVTLDDIATSIVEALADGRPGRFVVAGPEALSGGEAAAQLGAALGRPVRWETITPAAYGALIAPHLGPAYAAGVAAFYSAAAAAPPAPAPAPDTPLRYGATTLRAWAEGRRWGTDRAADDHAGRRPATRAGRPAGVS